MILSDAFLGTLRPQWYNCHENTAPTRTAKIKTQKIVTAEYKNMANSVSIPHNYEGITVKTLPGRNVTWSKRPRLGQNVHGHQVKTLPAIYVHYSVMNVISEWHSSTNVDP